CPHPALSVRAAPGPMTCPLSLHDALPISRPGRGSAPRRARPAGGRGRPTLSGTGATGWSPGSTPLGEATPPGPRTWTPSATEPRSEEHTSELQSREKLVCRLLLEKKNDKR